MIESRGYSGPIVVDLEGTLVPSGASLSEWASRVRHELHELARLPGVCKVTVVTNRQLSREEVEALGVEVKAGARKPWTSFVEQPESRPRIVIGDEWWTDGLLAWRYSACFILIRTGQSRVPWPTRLRERLFVVSGVPKLLFRPAMSEPVAKDNSNFPSRESTLAYLAILYQREGSLLTALGTIASLLVAFIALALTSTGTSPPIPLGDKQPEVRTAAAVGAPLIFGVFLYLYAQSRTIGAYIRRLEGALRTDLRFKDSLGQDSQIPIPFYGALDSALHARHRFGYSPIFRLAFGIVAFGIGLSICVFSLVTAWTLRMEWYGPLVIAGVAVLLLVEFFWFAKASAGHHFENLLPAAKIIQAQRDALRDPRASLLHMIQKVLLPRGDSITKGIWIILGGFAGIGIRNEVSNLAEDLLDLVLALLIIEIVVYQGRYLVNDMRDSWVDLRSLDTKVSGRIGDLTSTQVLILALSVMARLFGAYMLTNLASREARPVLRLAVAAIVILLIAYEASRDRRTNANQTRSDGRNSRIRNYRSELVGLLGSLGYTLRVGFGLSVVARDLIAESPLSIALFSSLLIGVTSCHYSQYLMGCILAAMEGLEPKSMASSSDGVATWYAGSIKSKPHHKWLISSIGLLADDAQPISDEDEKELRESPDKRDYRRWCDHPLAYRKVASSKWFKRRIFLTAAVGAWLALISLSLLGAQDGLDEFKIIGFGAVVMVARPWNGFKKWVRNANRNQSESNLAIAAPNVERDGTHPEKSEGTSKKIYWPRSAMVAVGLVTFSVGLTVASWIGLHGLVVSIQRVVSDVSLSVPQEIRALLLGAITGLIVLNLFSAPRSTAALSLGDLRRMSWHYRLQALKLGRALLAGPVILIFWKPKDRPALLDCADDEAGQLESRPRSGIERLEAALRMSDETCIPVEISLKTLSKT